MFGETRIRGGLFIYSFRITFALSQVSHNRAIGNPPPPESEGTFFMKAQKPACGRLVNGSCPSILLLPVSLAEAAPGPFLNAPCPESKAAGAATVQEPIAFKGT